MANSNLLLKGVSVLCVSLFHCVFCVFVAFFSLLVFSWCWCIWPLRATVPSWATKGYGLAYKGSSFLLLPLTLTIIYLFYRIRPETTDWDRELFSGVFMSLEVSVFLHSRLIFASRGVSPCWLADLLASLVRLRIYIYIFNAICGCWQCILKKVNKLFEKEKSPIIRLSEDLTCNLESLTQFFLYRYLFLLVWYNASISILWNWLPFRNLNFFHSSKIW